jgi:Ni,Fe-hydrogenase III large subunit
MIERVVEASACGVPIGAYADGEFAHYLFLDERGVTAVSQDRAARTLIAASAAIPLLLWDEHEMMRERDVRFDELPAKTLVQGDGIMHFAVGPVHAGIIEPGRFTFSSGGETIVHLETKLGYSHRGVERALEGVDALEAARLVARICGGCSAARSLAYALAVEELSGCAPAREIGLVRLVAAELERLYNHLADLAACASGAGYAAGFARGMALKERVMRLCSQAFGHRLLFDAIVPGGLGPAGFTDRMGFAAALRDVERATGAYLDALFANGSLASRWDGAGIVSAKIAAAFGAVGPAARASGGRTDIRALVPYAAYGALPVTVAGRDAGDALARCEVKRDELAESFRLIRAALGELGDAPLPEPLAVRPGAGVALRAVEGPRGAEIVAVHTDPQGRLGRAHVISASFRNWPLVGRAMQGNIVPDFPLVNKSFNLCYACADR